MLSALREELIGGKVILVDAKDTVLTELDIKEIHPVIDDALRLNPIEGYGLVYGKVRRALFEKDEELVFDADVTLTGKGGTVELDNLEIVQGALVRITNAVFSIAG